MQPKKLTWDLIMLHASKYVLLLLLFCVYTYKFFELASDGGIISI